MRYRLPHFRLSSMVSQSLARRSPAAALPATRDAARRALGQVTQAGGRLVGTLGQPLEHAVHRIVRPASLQVSTSPARPTAPLLVRAGPDAVVPDVRGSSEDEAIEHLVSAGLVVERLGADRSDGPPVGCVLRTRPPAGEVVMAGTTVGYIVASPLWPAPEAPSRHPDHIDPDAFMSLMRPWSMPSVVHGS